MFERQIVIVGGGISGLSAAYHLLKIAERKSIRLKVTLVERESWWGGKILTVTEGGFTVEGGPDNFVTVKPWALELCSELGLTERLLPTNPKARRVFILWRGKLHLLPHGFLTFSPDLKGLLETSLLSWQSKLRVALGVILPKPNWDEDVSVGKFLRYYLGTEMTERVIAPLMAGVYGGDIEQLSARMTLPTLWQIAKLHRNIAWASLVRTIRRKLSGQIQNQQTQSFFMTLKGGLSELVETLLANLKEANLLQKRSVVALMPDGETGKVAIRLDDGGEFLADVVILSTPAWAAADLLRPIDGTLADELYTIPHNHAITVSLAFERSQVQHPLNGSGFLVAPDEQDENLLLACTWTSSKYPPRAPQGKVLLRAFVNEWVDLSDDELVEEIVNALRPLLGIIGEPQKAWVFRWERAMPQYTVGHHRRIARISERMRHWRRIFLAGNYLTGIGIPDCIRAGKEAAEKALRVLG
ncbi:MAG: protoporphyrinogen oxidase [Armatimonadota bacterium]|nr:protoporphyrinogen oxidase [Armatimonadota bacterium]MDW8143871.1 protoporphyrinogen oxidase [Armatimonadota bacterium]